MLFFAQDRELAEEAWPGDIIGIPNHGTLRVGDTLTEGDDVRFTGLPNFAPEILRRVQLERPDARPSSCRQALDDLAEEGVTQVFKPDIGAHWIVGVVGQLQLEVLMSRLEAEYKVDIELEAIPYQTARWVSSKQDKEALETFRNENRSSLAEDRDGRLVFLARNPWDLDNIIKRYPKIAFRDTCELAS